MPPSSTSAAANPMNASLLPDPLLLLPTESSRNLAPETREVSRKQRTALGAMMLCQLITGSTYMIAKVGLQEFHPFVLGSFRFTIAGIVFGLILAFWPGTRFPERRDWGLFLWLAVLAVPLNQALFLYGQKFAPSTHGALLYALTPALVLVLSATILRELITPLKTLGIGLAFLGVLLVLFEKTTAFSFDFLYGDALIFAAVIVWAFFTIYSKRALERYSALEVTGYSLTLGGLLFLPIGLQYSFHQDFALITWRGIGSLLFLALATSVTAYLVWAWALKVLDTAKVAVIANLQPVVATFLGWYILQEPISGIFLLGSLVVITGVILTQKG